MHRVESAVWLLVLALLWGSGCATRKVWVQAFRGSSEHYHFERLDQAYHTPADDLVLCVWGTLPGRQEAAAYSLHLPGRRLRRPATDLGYRGHLVAVDGFALQRGWPQPARVQRQRWQPLAVHQADRQQAVGPQADAFRQALPLPSATRAALYNLRGYGAGDGLELVWVRPGADGGPVRRQSFTLQPLTRFQARQLSDLPGALVYDGGLAIGSTVGLLCPWGLIDWWVTNWPPAGGD